MKFALRDDDLNYFFTPTMLEEYYKYIWDICPVSMSVVPFIKGNWPEAVAEAERLGPGIQDAGYLKRRMADNTIYPIDKNIELVNYVHEQIKGGRIYLSIHAIHHRNGDKLIPQFRNNYGSGAEFFTKRDLTADLENAISYLEHTFNQKIEVFTPPQNKLNSKGMEAVLNNSLAICTDLPSIKSLGTLKLFGIKNYGRYLLFKTKNRQNIYPYVIKNNRLSLVAHQRLQPGTDLNRIKQEIDHAYKHKGVFVLSTHSYGFNYKMKKGNKKMGEALIEIIQYAKEKPNIEFVNLKQIFE